MRRAAVFVLLAGLVGGLAVAQPPAADKKAPPTKDDKDKKTPATPNDVKEAPKKPLPDTSAVPPPEDKSITSADGVTINVKFYKTARGGDAPTVILISDYKQDPNLSLWDGTAKLLAAGGYNTLRFAFRGHGDLRSLHSKIVDPAEFFGGVYSGMNRGTVADQGKPATKTSLNLTDFRPGYQPMLVQDLAAVRCLADQLNDTGATNTSSVYLIGAGSAINVGFLFLTAEWRREQTMPVVLGVGTVPPVSAGRLLLGGAAPAGLDYAGCVWLGPTNEPAVFPTQRLQDWVNVTTALKLRDTPMLFLHGSADSKGKEGARVFFDTVLKAGAKTSAGGAPLPKLDLTYKRDVKGAKNAGAGLLGNNLGTEQTVLEFLDAIEKDRKNKVRKSRGFDKPLFINVQSFGLMQ